jgi:ABC-type sugar transport system permease subunit/ABC-type glycerol-3-phosphate transport system substrate-binding protein
MLVEFPAKFRTCRVSWPDLISELAWTRPGRYALSPMALRGCTSWRGWAALLAFVALWLTSCGGTSDERTEIRFLPWQEDYDFVQPLVERYERENPGVRIRLLRAAEQNETLKTLLATGEPPDVFAIDVELFPAYHSVGALASLQPYLERDGFDESEYFRVTLDAFRTQGESGAPELFALPKDCTPYVLYYNKALFRQAGIEPPDADWTWEEFFAAAQSLTGPADASGLREQYGLSTNYWVQALMPWIWSSGGAVLDEEGRPVFDSPEVLRALRFLKQLIDAGVTPRQVHRAVSFNSKVTFDRGRVAMIAPAGRWVVNRIRDRESTVEYDVAPLPKGPTGLRATALAETGYCLSAVSEVSEEAYRFLRFLAGEAGARLMASRGIAVPALKSVAESDVFVQPDRHPKSDRVFLDALETARLNPTLPQWSEVKQIVREVLEACLVTERMTPEEACAQGQRRIEELLAREAAQQGSGPFPVLIFGGAALLVLLSLLALFVLAQRSRVRAERDERRAAMIFLSPWLFGFAVFMVAPLMILLGLAFSDWSAMEPLSQAKWVGLANFERLFGQDVLFWQSLRVTAWYVMLAVPAQLLLALGLALLLDAPVWARSWFRTAIYLPSLVSGVAMSVLWGWIFDARGGLLNEGLGALGIEGPDWLGDVRTVVPSFVIMSLWYVGGTVIVFLAGLQTIPRSLYDAARIDGAGWWLRLRNVTLPMLSPVILFNLVTLVIGSFQVFTQSYILTDGGPDNASLFYVLYVYRTAFKFHDMGYAAALAWVLFFVVLVLTLLILRGSKRFVHSSGGAGA